VDPWKPLVGTHQAGAEHEQYPIWVGHHRNRKSQSQSYGTFTSQRLARRCNATRSAPVRPWTGTRVWRAAAEAAEARAEAEEAAVEAGVVAAAATAISL